MQSASVEADEENFLVRELVAGGTQVPDVLDELAEHLFELAG